MTAPDLPGFLLARADDCERQAPDVHEATCAAVAYTEWGGEGYFADSCDCGEPARVLAECAALRAVVEQYIRLNTRPYVLEGHGCGLHPGDCFDEDGGNISDAGFVDYLYGPCAVWERVKRENPAAPPEATLRLLAQPFADHADYRPEWNPTV